MNQLLFYLLQVMAASGLLYGYYHFVLRNKKFHRYNRFYLLIAVVISIVVPFLNIPVYFTAKEAESSVVLQTLQVISSPLSTTSEVDSSTIQAVSTSSSQMIMKDILYTFYLLACSVFLIRIFSSLNKIRLLIKNHTIELLDKIKFINTDEPGTPFSFFRWLFWNRKIDMQSEKGEQIFRHELYHIQQKHTWDIIFIELLTTIFWVNPFFHLIKKEIKAIHEFLADEFAIKENNNWQYAELLLMQVLNTSNQLVHPFFHNQIKRRIAMITTSSKPKYQYLRKIMVLPITAIIICLFAFTYKNKGQDAQEFTTAMNSITVVIDAGHGGTDKGAVTSDGKFNEADLSLAIAKKIELFARDFNIHVIMTRSNEKFPGDASSKNEALRNRVDLVNNIRPHAFVSIHLNTTPVSEQNQRSGFDCYITQKKGNLPDRYLASSVLGEIQKIYNTRQEIKERGNAGIHILDESGYPSLLLECGFINNPKDIAFISNEKNQEQVAIAILKGLAKFSNSRFGKHDGSIHAFLDNGKGEFYREIEPRDTTKPLKAKDLDYYLVVIDGVIQKKRGLKNIDSALVFNKLPIEVHILKNKAAIDRYGEKGKDGVIEIILDKNSIPKVNPGPDTLAWIKEIPIAKKVSPTTAQLKTWQDPKIYGVWLDGKKISNDQLSKYKPSDFVLYYSSKLMKNAVNYGKHYYEICLYTDEYYSKRIAVKKTTSELLVKDIVLSDTIKTAKKDLLIVIDGKPRPDMTVNSSDRELSFEDLEKVIVLNDKSAIAKYGLIAKNGAVEIVTKKNHIKAPVVKEVTLKPLNDDDNKVFVKMDVEPSFPGGQKEWLQFLKTSLHSTVPVDSGAKEGTYTVILQFVVNKEGDVGDIRALTDHGFGMEQECIRVMKLSPKWKPGMQKGQVVKAYKNQPFTFVIVDDEADINDNKNNWKNIDQLAAVYPNPATNKATIRFKSNLTEKGEVQVYDAAGNLKFAKPINLVKGDNSVVFNVASYSAGTYIIIVVGADNKTSKTFKLIKR